MSRKILLHRFAAASAVVVIGLVFLTGLPAFAQRDAGAKARGDFESFWHPRYQNRTYTQNYQPYTPMAQPYTPMLGETRRSFSYEPTPFSIGDRVLVTVDQTRLMRGMQSLGVLQRGQSFVIRKIEGPWLGVTAEVNGSQTGGWVWHQHVASSPAQNGSAVMQPQEERRSFSYEPSIVDQPVYGSGRNYSQPRRDPWLYPKTDPRRFRP